MINFCEHRIVSFSLKFVFRGHCIILKSYNQWEGEVVFQLGGFVCKWGASHGRPWVFMEKKKKKSLDGGKDLQEVNLVNLGGNNKFIFFALCSVNLR